MRISKIVGKMIKLTKQQGKKFGIFGLSRTGISAFKALNEVASKIICYDDSKKSLDNFAQEFGIEYIVALEDKRWLDLDKIIISPGVPAAHQIFKLARKHNIVISSDIELFFEQNPDSRFIVITGTNGKSTTTALTGHILKQAGLDYVFGGNIGIPILSLPSKRKGYVLELSSFQIELLYNFEPEIAVLLNITPDHLDRYKDFAEYSMVKQKILQHDGMKIINIDNPETARIYQQQVKEGARNIIGFSTMGKQKNTVFCQGNKLVDLYFDNQEYKLPDLANLVGNHNRENIAASFIICRALGMQGKEIIKYLPSFKGLDHRLQFLGTKDNIDFYNDSKATNVAAARIALLSLGNIFWLVGGIVKENDLTPITDGLKNVKKAYIYGQSKQQLIEFLKDKIEYEICDNLTESFQKAVSDAGKISGKKNIILAPAASSFDQFKDYEARGEYFKELVDDMAEKYT